MAENSHAGGEMALLELNGHVKPSSDPEAQPLSGHAGTGEPPGDWDPTKCCKKQAAIAIGVLVSLVLVLICITIFQAVKLQAVKLPAEPESSDASSARTTDASSARTTDASSASPCPPGWKENEGKCYFFSDVQRNWTFSRSNCSSYGASLVMLDNQKEMEFLLSSRLYFWIDPKKEETKWLRERENGSLFLDNFDKEGKDLCPYMNEKKLSKTMCDNTQHWICVKPVVVP